MRSRHRFPRPKGETNDEPRHASLANDPSRPAHSSPVSRSSPSLLAIAAPAAFTDQASAKAQRPPKVAEVHFFKQSGEQGPATRLEVYGRRIESLKFKTRYAGKKAKATGAEFKPVTSDRFGHPWIPDPDKGAGLCST